VTASIQRPGAGRHVATVLFADVSGYSRLTEQLDPEELVGIMNRLLGGATEIIEAHGGTVNQFSGDDVKALFGVPAAHDDDPRRAVAAALALHRFVRELNPEIEGLRGQRLALHTAISTGVIVAQVRDQREGVFGVTGDAVNTAARLVTAAPEDAILVDAETHRAIAAYFVTEPLGPMSLRGKDRPVEVFRVCAPIPRSRFEVSRERGLSPYRGRASERATLLEAVEGARRGHGTFLALAGHAGIGKSRALFELGREVGDDVRVLYGRCQATGALAPFQPFLGLLRELLEVRDGDAPQAQCDRLVSAVTTLDPALAPHVPLYLHLLSLRTDDHPLAPNLQDDLLRAAILRSLVDLFVASARSRPLLVLLEDWHWADDSSIEALEALAAVVEAHRIVAIVTYRPEGAPAWRRVRPHVLQLRPLDATDARAVIVSRLGAEIGDRVADRLHDRTGGNPLFLEEVCRAFLERAASGSELTVDTLDVPPTVQAVIRSRIDRLEERDLTLLQVASVLGQRFSLHLLAAVLGERASAVAAGLGRLEQHELVSEARSTASDETICEFTHAITRDVAYETLLLEDRRSLHRKVGAAIEALYPADRLEEHYEVLAEHYERGEHLERAAVFWGRAGDKAALSFSLAATRTHYRRAIALLDRMAGEPDRLRLRIDLSSKWAAVCVYQPAEARLDVLRTSYDFAQRLGYRSGAARSVYWMGWFEHTFGNHRLAVGHFERALELADPATDRRLIAQLNTNLGQSYYHEAELALATEQLSRAIRLRSSGSSGRTIVIANALGYLGLVDAERGDFVAAEARVADALEIVRVLGQRQLEGSILTIAAFVALFRADWDACRARAAEMQTIADAIGASYIDAMSRTADGYAVAVGLGDPAGIETLREAVAAIEASGSRISMSVNCGCLAEALALHGRADEATAAARRALERAAAGDRIGEGQAHRALGIACARAGGPIDEARAHCARGLQVTDARGSTRDAAVTRFRLAEILLDVEPAEARSLIDAASTAFYTFGMRWYAAATARLRERLAARDPDVQPGVVRS
jgi:class 3 adenylate cyclase/tetratricopeptide (TPR) repeat protein